MAARVIPDMGLEPCPFCNGESEMKTDRSELSEWFWIRCKECGASQPSQGNISSTVKAWNRGAA